MTARRGRGRPAPITTRHVRRALKENGIPVTRPLRTIKPERIFTDRATVVVKILGFPESYLADLAAFARAGVTAEVALLEDPIEIAHDEWAVVVSYVPASQFTQACHAKAVGQLLRRIHDQVWPFADPPQDGKVYCPNDWFQENICITEAGPVMIDLDLAGAYKRPYAVGCAITDFSRRERDPVVRAQIKSDLLEGYGPHPDLEK